MGAPRREPIAAAAMATNTVRIRVWDLPTRLFHWVLVCCVIGSYITVKLGGLWMDWHVRLGLVTLGLMAFRLVWGLVGPRYARFSQFLRGPAAAWRYLRGQSAHLAGHNPLGAYSVMALLLSIGFQAVSGLFANDDVLTAGPLAYLSDDWSATLTALHKLNEWLMIALIALHVAAILWYQLKRHQDLLGPMIHGDAEVAVQPGAPVQGAQDTWLVRLGAAVLAAAIAAGVWWLTTLAPATEAFY